MTPAIHPRDRLLLRPLKSLGKSKSEIADISFLRRTQYVAEDRARLEGGGRAPTGQVKRRKVDISKEDPVYILRSTIKGFDVANPESAYTGPDNGTDVRGHTASFAEKEAWKNPKHPSKPNLKVLDSYPILPDLAGLTDDSYGGYAVVKFNGNPTDITNQFDERLETSLLRALEIEPEAMLDYNQRLTLHKANPDRIPEPTLPTMHYELFLPGNEMTPTNLKRKRDIEDPEKDSSALYTDASKDSQENDCFKFNNVREYETGTQSTSYDAPYQEIALALYDPEIEDLEVPSRLQKAAYFYPVVSRTQLRPRRAAQLARLGLASQASVEERSEHIDTVNLTFREPDPEEVEIRAQILGSFEGREIEAGT